MDKEELRGDADNPSLLEVEGVPAGFVRISRQCIEKIDVDAEAAYQDGLTWLSRGNQPAARQCTALALIAEPVPATAW